MEPRKRFHILLIFYQMFRMTIRATDESVPPVMIKLMEERLSIGFSTQSEELKEESGSTLSKQDIMNSYENVLVQ